MSDIKVFKLFRSKVKLSKFFRKVIIRRFLNTESLLKLNVMNLSSFKDLPRTVDKSSVFLKTELSMELRMLVKLSRIVRLQRNEIRIKMSLNLKSKVNKYLGTHQKTFYQLKM
jgi:hypothetical protein